MRSLITGVAGQATTQVGNLVNTQSVLTAVSQLNPIKVYFSISDSEYLALVQRTHGSGDLLKSKTAIPLTLTLANGEVEGPQRRATAEIGHLDGGERSDAHGVLGRNARV